MNKKLKIFLIIIALIIVSGFAVYNYVMHGGERNLATEQTAFSVSSGAITAEFTSNLDASNKKYLEKPIAILGKVTAVNDMQVTIDNSIICELKTADATVQKDQKVTVKGRVVGYDDLMSELKLDQCFIIKN
jgi:maltose-binding protein MalE